MINALKAILAENAPLKGRILGNMHKIGAMTVSYLTMPRKGFLDLRLQGLETSG